MVLEKDPIYLDNPMWVELGHADIIRKLDIAKDAGEVVGEVASDLSVITEEDALTFGPMYIAYYAETILHNEDRISIEIEAAKITGDFEGQRRKEKGYSPEWVHDGRMKLERALFDAAKGNYAGIKLALIEEWQHELDNPYYGRGHYASAFMQFVEIMPDITAPFVPPRPAWMDFDDLE